jgi:hypothetical protein
VVTGREVTAAEVAGADRTVVWATGGRPRPPEVPVGDGVEVVGARDVLAGAPLPPGPVVVHDPVGGPAGVGVAELLAAAGRAVTVVTPHEVVGVRLAGDLAPANTRLLRAGVRRETASLLRSAGDGAVLLADRWTGALRTLPCAVLVDAAAGLPGEVPPGAVPAGDVVAPRTVLEAVLEGRRAAAEVLGPGGCPPQPAGPSV